MEFWKDVPGYEELYQASTYGRIRSKPGKTTYTEYHGERAWASRILKEKNKKAREKRVDLWKDGEVKTHLVHRLVADTFLEEEEGKPCINHKDGNPKNNHIENLERCTYKENIDHAYDNGLIGANKTILLFPRGAAKEFRSMRQASKHIGLSPNAIGQAYRSGKNTVIGVAFIVKERKKKR